MLVATPFDDVDDIAALANGTAYGLAAASGPTTSSASPAIRGSRPAPCWVNCHGLLDNALPFGGYKAVGIRPRDGRAMIDLYTETSR